MDKLKNSPKISFSINLFSGATFYIGIKTKDILVSMLELLRIESMSQN